MLAGPFAGPVHFPPPSSGAVQPPLTGLVAWYKADAGVTEAGGAVSAQADQSGNGYDLAQGTGANQPTFLSNQLNGLPALSHDAIAGSNEFLTRASTPVVPQPYTVVSVVKITMDNLGNGIISDSGPGGDFSLFYFNDALECMALYAGGDVEGTSDPRDGNFHVVEAIFNGGSSSIRVDGVLEGSGNAGGSGLTGLTLGGNNAGSDGLGGLQVETFVYDHAIDAGHRAALAAYFAARFGI